MTVTEAKEIRKRFWDNPNPSSDDEFMYVEANKFLLEETKESKAMLMLGYYYYERKHFDLALKYMDMAAENGQTDAYMTLGYIWYYGRTGEKNYKKAYNCFKIKADEGSINAKYKIADMYKNGYFVEKNREKYKEIVEDLYRTINADDRHWHKIPEIYSRLAGIRKEEGKYEECVELLLRARDVLEYKLKFDAFFGDITIMKYLIRDLYEIVIPNEEDIRLYDLFWYLDNPCRIDFKYKRKVYTVESVQDEEGISIKFQSKWYRNTSEFFEKATIGDLRITNLNDELYMFEVCHE